MSLSPRTPSQLELMRKSGVITASALKAVLKAVKPGISLLELESIARSEIVKLGGSPSFMTVSGYSWATCLTVNNEVVHGIPSEGKVLQDGDVVAIDMGLIHGGLITDSAVTVVVGAGDEAALKLADITKKALQKGIEAVKPGNTVGDIGYAIEQFVKPFGYGHAEGLAGHGVGYKVHEDPFVPNTGKKGDGEELRPGMVIAIEPMLNEGTGKVVFDKDGYTVRTKDGKRSAHFEHTVAVTENGHIVLTA